MSPISQQVCDVVWMGGMVLRDAVYLVEATGRCGVPRGGNREMRRASWRQRGDAACLVEATGRCGVPRGGNRKMRRASWRQRGGRDVP